MRATIQLAISVVALVGCGESPGPVPASPQAICSLEPTVISGGAFGFCEESGATFALRFANDAGDELLRFDWPDDLPTTGMPPGEAHPTGSGCEELCEAGLMELIETSDLLQDSPTFSDAPAPPPSGSSTNSCYVAKNGRRTYTDCGDGTTFQCLGACGAGCVGCNVRVTNTDCGPPGTRCSARVFRCYTKDCCDRHDRGLGFVDQHPVAIARTALRIAQHVWAARRGCSLEDATGDDWDAKEATCMDFLDPICSID